MNKHRSRFFAGATALMLALSALAGTPGAAQAATSLPCDIYGNAGTPCVAAHSTVRALYAGYSGKLYQVTRASDQATLDIKVLKAGGYADAAAQDAFCAGTTCIISKLYDQSPHHNDLHIEAAGIAGKANNGADATALPITAGGHKVYGMSFVGRTGYRLHHADGVATGADPEGMYMVASGTHVNDKCCFDYGNAENVNADTGAVRMDAVYLGTRCVNEPCTGVGPWVAADLENGLYRGSTANLGNATPYVTAMLKNDGRATFAVKGGNSQSGTLSTWYDGPLPSDKYIPMQKAGSIVLGTGGDNSNADVGSFFEGVMTSGFPTDAADDAVQANIVSVGYSGPTGG